MIDFLGCGSSKKNKNSNVHKRNKKASYPYPGKLSYPLPPKNNLERIAPKPRRQLPDDFLLSTPLRFVPTVRVLRGTIENRQIKSTTTRCMYKNAAFPTSPSLAGTIKSWFLKRGCCCLQKVKADASTREKRG